MGPTRPLVLLAVVAALMVGCGQSEAPVSVATTSASPPAASADGAVRVPQGYAPPTDRVPSTGATVPANGKPTLVFVDAIW
jgi:hypothetical protein